MFCQIISFLFLTKAGMCVTAISAIMHTDHTRCAEPQQYSKQKPTKSLCTSTMHKVALAERSHNFLSE